MIPAVRGRLLTASFVRDLFQAVPGAGAAPQGFLRALVAWWERCDAMLGPTSTIRAIADAAIIPLLQILDLRVTSRAEIDGGCLLETACGERQGPHVLVVGWNQPLSLRWRDAVLRAIKNDARWSLCTNGTALRIIDARRTWSREHLEFDLRLLGDDVDAGALAWSFVRGPAITADAPILDVAVDVSARHGVDVCRALGAGVLQALTLLVDALRSKHGRNGRMVFEHCVTVLYRVLFLLFAEARGLVPLWHPIYRERYSLDVIVTTLVAGRPCPGLWHAVQAISRLAHAGCSAGELRVNAFNGRLFSSTEAASFERAPVPDAVMAGALMAVSTRPVHRTHARVRIIYRDLNVEQLGAVYEQVLEYAPTGNDRSNALTRTREGRKASGTFYTPRQLTAFVVRTTLGPLVEGRSADEILRLRVLDPAMGSGAFIVASCRYLASAAEEALIQEGRWHHGDVTTADRVALRREVALRCLFGVDLNPMAVQLARLSVWLATLAADKPLSFLDHHLVTGDSLVGASPRDIQRQPTKVPGRGGRQEPLPLFSDEDLEPALQNAVRIRLALSMEPDDSPQVVREKERTLATLGAADAALGRLSRLLDLWCAGWFWEPGAAPDRTLFHELSDRLLHDRSALPSSLTTPLLARAAAIAGQHRFLHWPLAFPEVFTDEHGRSITNPGFDAVLSNPPWDMVRGDSGANNVRASRRLHAAQLTAFVKESGVYRVENRAHVNRYQLFVERAIQLVRAGGRIGLVLPSGVVSDAGGAALRRHLFDRTEVDSITGLDNRGAIFPIHRSVRFALLTATSGRPTTSVACRFGLSRVDQLEAHQQAPIAISRRLLARVSGEDDLGVPEVATEIDLRIVERISAREPWLGSESGWHVKFGRELNATDDRDKFGPSSGRRDGRPVVEGKQIEAFRVALDECRLEMRPGTSGSSRVTARPRVAYRDVASATNRLTLIAAIVPAHAVTTHTLFVLKTRMAVTHQHVLCALLNSFVANYLIRLRVNTHVTVSLVSRLPVPIVSERDPAFLRLIELSRALSGSSADVETMREYAELQAIVARLYRLTRDEFEHVLTTFPLVGGQARASSLERFKDLL